MGRLKSRINRQFSNEEKEKILLEHYNEHVSWEKIYKKNKYDDILTDAKKYIDKIYRIEKNKESFNAR